MLRLVGLVAIAACAPGPSIELVDHATSETIRGIDRGVLFLDARWSVPAQRTRLALIRQLDGDPVKIVIADLDGAQLADVPELRDNLHGSGEQAWILGGTVCLVCAGPTCIDRGRALVTQPLRATC